MVKYKLRLNYPTIGNPISTRKVGPKGQILIPKSIRDALGLRRVLGKRDGISQGRKLLGFPNLRFIEVNLMVLTTAQTLLDRYGLNPRDSIHLASALSRKLKRFISDDEDFDKVKEVERIPLE